MHRKPTPTIPWMTMAEMRRALQEVRENMSTTSAATSAAGSAVDKRVSTYTVPACPLVKRLSCGLSMQEFCLLFVAGQHRKRSK
jgi:hypothetical protein